MERFLTGFHRFKGTDGAYPRKEPVGVFPAIDDRSVEQIGLPVLDPPNALVDKPAIHLAASFSEFAG